MAALSWYFEAPDGRRFNWNKEPTYTCPHEGIRYEVHDFGTGKVTITDARPADEAVGITFSRYISEETKQAAAALGVDPLKLAKMITAGHRSTYGRERVDGKLTEKCRACGAKMERLGFRCWIDRPVSADEATEGEQASKAIAGRLGFADPRRTVQTFYAETKREADRWARDELATAHAVAAEEG